LGRIDDRKAHGEPDRPEQHSTGFRALFAANPLLMWVYDLETLVFLA
jgi:hypothetical protein